MAYRIHIHRRPTYWAKPSEGDITLDEVKALALKYPHLEFVEREERIGIGQCCGGKVCWTDDNILMGFQFADGQLTADYVDDETIYRALYLAGLMKAKVQGDEGEFYRAGADGVEYYKS